MLTDQQMYSNFHSFMSEQFQYRFGLAAL